MISIFAQVFDYLNGKSMKDAEMFKMWLKDSTLVSRMRSIPVPDSLYIAWE